MSLHGYALIRTPIFEKTELFNRSIGENTDIVNKEMYTWIDRDGTSLTLSPESTASVVRSYIQNRLGNLSPIQKLYYIDSSFRRERPQKGRQRQFTQYGIEAIGSAHPEQDLEYIKC
jgi:histidyl-tRNA synthetase